MNEPPKPKPAWRITRRLLIALAVIATLIAVIYTEEDWRGKRAWENYQREWQAKGEKFDWQAFVPPAVPDDQNFFKAPIVTNVLSGRIPISTDGIGGSPNVRSSYWADGKPTDLPGWQAYYRNLPRVNSTNQFLIAPQSQTPAADVSLALSRYDDVIEELRQAAKRPDARLPLNYEDGFNAASSSLSDLAALKRCCSMLELRAVAELANNQSAKACDDVDLLFSLNESIRNQPYLISHLVRMAILQLTLQPIWEGVAGRHCTDQQLATISEKLSKLDFLADYQFCLRGERACAIETFENERITREMITVGNQKGSEQIMTNYYHLAPSAFFYQNELAYAQMAQQWALPLVDTRARVISPGLEKRSEAAVEEQTKHYSPYKIMALMTFPALASTAKRFAFAQTGVDLARVACALERYHLAHGEYPESLDALTPQLMNAIPHDIINGKPLHYHRTSDGKFLLYSVGWNETDDGGQIVLTKNGNFDLSKGDWVWPSVE